jgi:hypothetical protein
MKDNKWVRLLAYITGMVNQRLLLQCEYLAAEKSNPTLSVSRSALAPMSNARRWFSFSSIFPIGTVGKKTGDVSSAFIGARFH